MKELYMATIFALFVSAIVINADAIMVIFAFLAFVGSYILVSLEEVEEE